MPQGHPGYKDALEGKANPRDPKSKVSPDEHNSGNTNSAYTSWSYDPKVAQAFAKDGVVLEYSTGVPGVKYVISPDKYFEQEVLIKGSVSGAKVKKP